MLRDSDKRNVLCLVSRECAPGFQHLGRKRFEIQRRVGKEALDKLGICARDVYYHIRSMVLDILNWSSSVEWYLNRVKVVDSGWMFDVLTASTTDVHNNILLLRAHSHTNRVYTLYCKIPDQPYGNNIVNTYIVKIKWRASDIPSLKFPVQYCPLFADRQLIISCVAALSSFQNDRWHWYLDDVALDGGTWWLVVSKPGRYRCSYASHENGEKDILEFDVKEPHGGSPRRPNEWQFCAYNITLNDGS
ncbi:hypothetical protein LSH36_276g03040 [Paralvinella palmiformis]|uniref:Uncharacterized protein n=1 Tax=Paralvinella palmiformis TaxID=53620 RepID=A0AAD9N3I8_9ANNE|nr:hypothetical protein LSH36_276g03040 [Paralvinella palmiformis]